MFSLAKNFKLIITLTGIQRSNYFNIILTYTMNNGLSIPHTYVFQDPYIVPEFENH